LELPTISVRFRSAFKAKVALEALKGEQTVTEIASKLHPTLVTDGD